MKIYKIVVLDHSLFHGYEEEEAKKAEDQTITAYGEKVHENDKYILLKCMHISRLSNDVTAQTLRDITFRAVKSAIIERVELTEKKEANE